MSILRGLLGQESRHAHKFRAAKGAKDWQPAKRSEKMLERSNALGFICAAKSFRAAAQASNRISRYAAPSDGAKRRI